ncbi:MAG: NAD(P)-binding domain-containing protein [Gordonia sp. (in: high G+C Gram-positive bacteria)]|uniref:flavin-containing monooxygenase n=1 Tax=Gordonia sp. (in: high G+C Gram-positive bacteria) TaxID=84139 RepID=UPI0039E55F13
MRVCVVGAGSSGLTTIKQLRDEGHEVVCYDRNDDLGGLWLREGEDAGKTKACDNLFLTISIKLMAYSDHPHRGDRVFYTRAQYWEYLRSYARRYGLADHIRFGTEVTDLTRHDGGWTVATRRDGVDAVEEFDAVAVCSGPFKTPNTDLPGIEKFSGEVIHSAGYRNAEPFRGRRVLIVGLAESGADVVREVAEVADECTLVIRSRAFLLPRVEGSRTTDHGTVRSHHHEMLRRSTEYPFVLPTFWGDSALAKKAFLSMAVVLGVVTTALGVLKEGMNRVLPWTRKPEAEVNPLGQPMHPLKIDIDTPHTEENFDAIRQWNRTSHPDGSWTQKAIFCKNVSFIPALVDGRVLLNDTGIDGFDGATVRFGDGTSGEFDTIILCTGYKPTHLAIGDLTVEDGNVRNLYRHFLHPDHDGTAAFIGFIRPLSGAVPLCAEMQARYFARVLNGKLPVPTDLRERIATDKAWEEHWTSLSPTHPESTPSNILYLDALAKEIGCLIPMSMMMRNPRLFMQMWFGTFNQACYRVVGPHSNRREALADLYSESIDKRRFFAWDMTVLQLAPSHMHPEHLF